MESPAGLAYAMRKADSGAIEAYASISPSIVETIHRTEEEEKFVRAMTIGQQKIISRSPANYGP
jgi:hypothetical protein